ncbi:hypothetical protein [Chromohalobacter japonicus]|uniref:hypothetical protein n=1 Tax=Chromohalobacter japonicus TaxID=223900 RepID=UPI000B038ED8
MKRVVEKALFKVQTALTDNDKSFTDRFARTCPVAAMPSMWSVRHMASNFA